MKVVSDVLLLLGKLWRVYIVERGYIRDPARPISLSRLLHVLQATSLCGYRKSTTHIGMPLFCEMVLVKKLELEATEFNLKNNKYKLHTPALVYK
jgi:hypothetical protein